MFVYFWEMEFEWGRGRERGRHRIQSSLQALSYQYRAHRGAHTCKSEDHDLSWSQTPNQLSPPGALSHLLVSNDASIFFHSGLFLSLLGCFLMRKIFMSFLLCILFPLHNLKPHLEKRVFPLLLRTVYRSLQLCPSFNQHISSWETCGLSSTRITFSFFSFPPFFYFFFFMMKQNHLSSPLPLAYMLGRVFAFFFFKTPSHWLFVPVLRPWNQSILCFKEKQQANQAFPLGCFSPLKW